MKARKTIQYSCFFLGTALLLAALFLVLYNLHEDRQGGEQAEAVLAALQESIPEYVPEVTTVLTAEAYDLYAEYEETTTTVSEPETAEVDGHNYIGYLSIPEIDIALPVMAEWSYPNLKIAPCRYTGDLTDNNLIIAAHNYSTHFGKIGKLSVGSELVFTDLKGKKHSYCVTEIEQLPGTAVEEMQFGSGEDWDLTLFTCTLNGQSRVTVRAKLQ